MNIKIDLHTHTVRSHDGRQTLKELTAAAKAAGLQAVAVTDHQHYEALPQALNGILLIPGCEFSTSAGHITGLFLKQPPCTAPMTPQETVREIHRCGGIAVLAHPFQKPGREEAEFNFSPDALETANARAAYKNKGANAQAAAYAAKRRLPALGGSDAHSAKEVANAYTSVRCSACTADAIEKAIRQGSCKAILQKNTPRRMIGLSQLRRRRNMGGFKNAAIGLLYLAKCIAQDLFQL